MGKITGTAEQVRRICAGGLLRPLHLLSPTSSPPARLRWLPPPPVFLRNNFNTFMVDKISDISTL